jgi:hypothetical protein
MRTICSRQQHVATLRRRDLEDVKGSQGGKTPSPRTVDAAIPYGFPGPRAAPMYHATIPMIRPKTVPLYFRYQICPGSSDDCLLSKLPQRTSSSSPYEAQNFRSARL